MSPCFRMCSKLSGGKFHLTASICCILSANLAIASDARFPSLKIWFMVAVQSRFSQAWHSYTTLPWELSTSSLPVTQLKALRETVSTTLIFLTPTSQLSHFYTYSRAKDSSSSIVHSPRKMVNTATQLPRSSLRTPPAPAPAPARLASPNTLPSICVQLHPACWRSFTSYPSDARFPSLRGHKSTVRKAKLHSRV